MSNAIHTISLVAMLCGAAIGQQPIKPLSPLRELPIPPAIDFAGSFTLRLCVRLPEAPKNLPTIAANKNWQRGPVRDFTTNNAYGLGRDSGKLAGFAISVLPDGAWTFNAGDGRRRIDHRPEAADQGIADGRWHEVGFAIDRDAGVAHLYHDGRRVAAHDLHGIGDLTGDAKTMRMGDVSGLQFAHVRFADAALSPSTVRAEFATRFGAERTPAPPTVWNGEPLRVLAWNIWHGGRRKGRDEGVQRVVDVISESKADIVLMQETYGSGPRISGRLGFDYFLRSSNLSVMSRYPIVATHRLGPAFRFGGVTIALREDVRVQAYSLWINYLPDVGKQVAAGANAESITAADRKTRGKEMDTILAELLPHLAKTPTMPAIVGGDFNSGSHLDWIAAAKHLDNHRGLIVPWPAGRAMAKAGFVDTFRAANPDPVAKPGLTWSPEFPEDHQDRIDYVYVRGEQWNVVASEVLRTHPDGWPSDHAAVLSTLQLTSHDDAPKEGTRRR